MTKRVPIESAPGPLEDFAAHFDALFSNRAQSERFRRYLEGLLFWTRSATRRSRHWQTPSRWTEHSIKRRNPYSGFLRSPAGTLKR
jgi:hypothetical protein